MRSARELLNDHIDGGQAKLAGYKRAWAGSGVWVAETDQQKQIEQLTASLVAARDVLENAQHNDLKFREAVDLWVRLEFGHYSPRPKRWDDMSEAEKAECR